MIPRLIPTTCPHCATDLDAHDGVSGTVTPDPGDVTVCWYCRNLAIFVSGPFGLYLRKPTTDEYDECANHPTVLAALGALAVHDSPTAAAKAVRGER
jgi:hypothetical protein